MIPAKHPETERSFEIDFVWTAVEALDGTAYGFPNGLTPRMKVKYSSPAVYRWTVNSDKGKLVAIYFGETENLYRRMGQYLRPGPSQKTNLRIKAQSDQALLQRSSIGLEVLSFEAFTLNSVKFDDTCLGYSYMRQCLENLTLANFICISCNSGCIVMNVSESKSEKMVLKATADARRILDGLPASERKKTHCRAGRKI